MNMHGPCLTLLLMYSFFGCLRLASFELHSLDGLPHINTHAYLYKNPSIILHAHMHEVMNIIEHVSFRIILIFLCSVLCWLRLASSVRLCLLVSLDNHWMVVPSLYSLEHGNQDKKKGDQQVVMKRVEVVKK